MTLALIGALVLSVIGWTAALFLYVIAVKHRVVANKALAGWKMAEYRALLSRGLLDQCHHVNQALRNRLQEQDDSGEAWKNN